MSRKAALSFKNTSLDRKLSSVSFSLAFTPWIHNFRSLPRLRYVPGGCPEFQESQSLRGHLSLGQHPGQCELREGNRDDVLELAAPAVLGNEDGLQAEEVGIPLDLARMDIGRVILAHVAIGVAVTRLEHDRSVAVAHLDVQPYQTLTRKASWHVVAVDGVSDLLDEPAKLYFGKRKLRPMARRPLGPSRGVRTRNGLNLLRRLRVWCSNPPLGRATLARTKSRSLPSCSIPAE